MPFSGKLQTETNEMTTRETKYQTEFYSAKTTNIKPKFKKIVLNMPIKYQENTKNFGTEVPITDLVLAFSWSWYTKFLVTDWHPGPLTRSHSLTVTFTTDVPHTTAHYRGLRPNPVPPDRPTQARSGPVAVGHQHQSHWQSKVGGRRPHRFQVVGASCSPSPPPGLLRPCRTATFTDDEQHTTAHHQLL